MAIETRKFSEFDDAGDLAPEQETVGVNTGINVRYNNPFPLLPPGTTAARPAIAASMYYRLRFNTTIESYEYYSPVTMDWIQLEDSGDLENAPFVIYTADPTLPSSFNLGSLTSGMLRQTVTAGVATPNIAVLDVDYYGPGMTGYLQAPIGVKDSSGNIVVGFTTQALSVNYLNIVSAPAGSNPSLLATGTDTNIGMSYTAKGSGGHFFSSTSTEPVAFFSGTAYQHETVFEFANTLAARTVTWPDADGTVAFTSGASGIVNPGLINQLGYYAAGGTTISGLTIVNQGVLTTNGTGVPAWVALTAGQVLVGTTSGAPIASSISSGTNILVTNGSGSISVGLTGIISPVLGGTGVSNLIGSTITLGGPLELSGAFATTFNITGATNVTFPTTGTLATTSSASGIVNSGTQNQMAWYAATGTTVSGLATANNGVLVTSAGGVPSIATTLPAGLTIPTPIIAQINDAAGLPVLSLSTNALAVNYLDVLSNITTAAPQLRALGSDTNISLTLAPKGTGGVIIDTAAPTIPLLLISGTGFQHSTAFAFANTAASRTVTFPDADGTVAFTSSASGIVNSGTAGQLAYYAGSGTTVSGLALGTGVLTALGVNVNGSGAISLTTSPTFVTPVLGAAAATSINFGGTTLANYVEGTWTPAFTGTGGGSATYTLQQAGYTRIGNRVLFDLTIIISASTLVGNISITGLPIPIGAQNGAAAGYYATMGATATPSIWAQLTAGGSAIPLFVYASGTATALTATNLGSAAVIVMSGHYVV